jgi:hypothetical protein
VLRGRTGLLQFAASLQSSDTEINEFLNKKGRQKTFQNETRRLLFSGRYIKRLKATHDNMEQHFALRFQASRLVSLAKNSGNAAKRI